MSWYNEAIFYHIYPLGMCGAPEKNEYTEPVSRINKLIPWISHIKDIGCNAVYIGPLFESVGHGYETTDYKKTDSRLGTNEDLRNFIKKCHEENIRVIFDGVFNHTGRDFFAFRDIKENRENSSYKNWYNMNFWGNNSYNDSFSYENWGGYDLLVKLNQKNPEVTDYICDVVRYWVHEFDIDGIRLDAADVLDFSFMKTLRNTANEVKPDFWLMGEVIHGDYNRWANENTLHSVTNYHLHKALYSGHNDHNYFEIAHTVTRLQDICKNLRLYNFVDNHDVERIYTKLNNKRHFVPVHILLYTLPGIPSIYYGSEFGIEGRKERHSDASLRPTLEYEKYKDNTDNPYTNIIKNLGKIKKELTALSYGDYKELLLTNRQYAFCRRTHEQTVLICVNNDEGNCTLNISSEGNNEYTCAFSGKVIKAINGRLSVEISGCSGEILYSGNCEKIGTEPVKLEIPLKAEEVKAEKVEKVEKAETSENVNVSEKIKISEKTAEEKIDDVIHIPDKPYEEMSIKELQAVILNKMAANGPVTDRMKQDVYENVYHNSLVTWAKSFR